IERRGAPTALLTTRGFRDILAMGKEQRYDIYDLFLRFPEPLVPRPWRVEVAERMSRDGVPLQTPALATVRQQVACLVDQGVEGELAQRGFAGQFHLMQSSGGLASPQTARRFPIRLLESGPAGGAMVGAFLGRAVGLPDLITFDMGGTTAKTCLISRGKPDLA